MKSKILGLVAVGFMGACGAAATASANIIEAVDLTFASGATFVGNVTFANDFSSYSAVSGVLNGYEYGNSTYNSAYSDTLSWVWTSGVNATNFATGSNNFSNFLMDGTGIGDGANGATFSNFIQFGYSYTGSGITLFTGGLGVDGNVNNVDYVDPLVSGGIASVPEPATLSLLGLGLVGVGLARRRRRCA